ncbi:MAG TPA: gamma-glutamyl-gamma-aminobutyrate hydrolase family protein [Vulgatibacter sp.]|nr:gamma-glutamyl-gamma-aminobutyrate hydrolase family protein [Vulgatibacter sp.]
MTARVLVTPDFEEASPPRYFLKRSYADAVLAADGIPLVPAYGAPIAALLGWADAVVVTGGAFDVDPSLYGEERREACGPAKAERTGFERAILEGALERRLPVLGVCGGMQLLNVVRGGSLHQDVLSEIEGAFDHEQKTPSTEAVHAIEVTPATRLAEAASSASGTLRVNSTHHQAVKRLGEGLVVSARAPDGVVEAIEDPALPFVVGVQWHPEQLADSPWNAAIYRQLVAAAERMRA